MTKKLKIAVVVDQLLPGGVQKVAIEEVRWINKLGADAKLVVLMRKGFENKHQRLLKGLPYEFLSDRYPKFLRRSFKLPFFNFLSTLHLISPIYAPFKINRNEFDIIVSHGTTTSLTTWSISKFNNIPYLAVIHDPMVYILDKVYSKTPLKHLFFAIKPISSFLEANFTKSANACLVDSSVHANFLKNKYHVKPKILHLGINPPKLLPSKRGKSILSFGRWDSGKNPHLLLEILQKITSSRLIIAGNWTNLQDLKHFKKQIKQKSLEKRVEIIPKYTEEELSTICSLGRVWIHPHFEAFSLSALEAAANGLPIIIPAKSGVTEIFENKTHGFFPNKVNVGEFIKYISIMLKNERLAYKMGLAAAKTARNLSPQNRAKVLLRIIETITSTPIGFIAVENGHITGSLVSGGDRLLEEMLKRNKKPLPFKIIIPKIARDHWQKSKLKVSLITLAENKFEQSSGPLGVAANYAIRTWQSYKILSKLPRDNITIVYSSTGIWPDTVPVFLAKITNSKIKWVSRIHHLLPLPNKRPGRIWVNIGSYLLEQISIFSTKFKADKVLVLNENLKKELINKGYRKDKIMVLGGGVDFGAISKMKEPKVKKFDAIFLGRIHHAKGVFDLVPIWKEVLSANPQAKLAIVGTGPKETVNQLKSQIEQAHLNNNIFNLGYLKQKQVWESLKNSKLFLFTDHEAGFGLAAAEAMAGGLPAIGWDIGILGSVFKSGYIKVPINDYKTFADSIIKILTIQSLQKKLSQEAISEAQKLDWLPTSNRFEKILSDLQEMPA